MALLIVAAILLFTTLLAVTRPRLAVMLGCWLLPWQGLDLDVGVRVTAALAFLVPLFVRTIWTFAFRPKNRLGLSSNMLLPYLLLCLGVSLLSLPSIPSQAVFGGEFRSPVLRALVQMMVFLVIAVPAFAIPLFLRSAEDLNTLVRGYLYSLVALCILGWLQLLSWYATGFNLFPVGLFDLLLGTAASEYAREGQFIYEGIQVYRMNSLGGEPKNLGGALAFGLLALKYAHSRGLVTPRTAMSMLGLFVLSSFATYSTAALYLMIIVLIGLVLLAPLLKRKADTAKRAPLGLGTIMVSLTVVAVVIVAGVQYSKQLESSQLGLLDMLSLRTIERERVVIEDFDGAIIDFLLDNPQALLIGAGLGNIHLFADSYLPPEVASYAAGRVFAAKSAYLKIASEAGLVGLLLFLITVLRICFSRHLLPSLPKTVSTPTVELVAVTTLAYMAALSGPEVYLALGIAFFSIDEFSRLSTGKLKEPIFAARSVASR